MLDLREYVESARDDYQDEPVATTVSVAQDVSAILLPIATVYAILLINRAGSWTLAAVVMVWGTLFSLAFIFREPIKALDSRLQTEDADVDD